MNRSPFMNIRHRAIPLVAAFLAISCTPAIHIGSSPSTATATAALRDQTGRQIGSVTLTDSYAGVLLSGVVNGLGIGAHGIHIHETGKCEAPFTSAGGHFNPRKRHHGFKNPDGSHAGDLPNIETPAAGQLKFELLLPGVSLTGRNGLLDADGSAVVIHGAGDDYMTDPAGNSGSRIVCGVIAAR
jgi:Cu-Zn family superoxide dismutase